MLVYTVSKGRKKLHPVSFSFSPQTTIIIYPNAGNWKQETPGMLLVMHTQVLLNTNCY